MIKKLKSTTYTFHGEERRCDINVVIMNNNISIESDRYMYKDIIFDVLLDREINKAVKEFLKDYIRKHSFKINTYFGRSGNAEYKLVVANPIGITVKPTVVNKMYISCNDKWAGCTNMYLGDFIEFLAFIDEEYLRQILSYSLKELKRERKKYGSIFYTRDCKYEPILEDESGDYDFTRKCFIL